MCIRDRQYKAAEQAVAVVLPPLQAAGRPAAALLPALAECKGLLVIEDVYKRQPMLFYRNSFLTRRSTAMMTGPASTAMATGTRSAPSTAAVPKKP